MFYLLASFFVNDQSKYVLISLVYLSQSKAQFVLYVLPLSTVPYIHICMYFAEKNENYTNENQNILTFEWFFLIIIKIYIYIEVYFNTFILYIHVVHNTLL